MPKCSAGSTIRTIRRRIPTRCGRRLRRRSSAGTSSASRCAIRSSLPPSACSRVPLEALLLALAAAFLHAGWNVLLRGSEDVAARTVVVLCLSVVLFAPVAAATWSVHARALPYIAASAVLEAVYFVLLIAAYRR